MKSCKIHGKIIGNGLCSVPGKGGNLVKEKVLFKNFMKKTIKRLLLDIKSG